jgi:hypothetical protein
LKQIEEKEEEKIEDIEKYAMYQNKLQQIMNNDNRMSSNDLEFSQGSEEQEEEYDEEDDDEESVNLSNINMNVLMDEYKMIKEDTQLVISSLRYQEPVMRNSNNNKSHSLNESEVESQFESGELPEVDMYAAIMEDQEMNHK